MIPLIAGAYIAGGAIIGGIATWYNSSKKSQEHNKKVEGVLDEILKRQKEHEDDLNDVVVNDKEQTAEEVAFNLPPKKIKTEVDRILEKVRKISDNQSRFDLIDLE